MRLVPRLARALAALALATANDGLSRIALRLAPAIAPRGTPPAEPDRLHLLFGVRAIGRELGLSRQQVRSLHAVGALPTFDLGGVLCARRTTLRRHIEALERNSVRDPDRFR